MKPKEKGEPSPPPQGEMEKKMKAGRLTNTHKNYHCMALRVHHTLEAGWGGGGHGDGNLTVYV
jgi:hypothetical protein